MKIFSIKNEKLGFFNRPIYCESEAEALSYIQNILMSDSDRALSNLKDDLSLYFLGSIDFTTGKIYCGNVLFAEKLDDVSDDPVKVCSLREIFDTIPEDKLKPAITRDDLKECLDYINKVKNEFYNEIQKLDKCKKGVKLYS